MNNSSRSGSGASSIMVIITVVCMTVFGVLALVSVRSENKLSYKTTEAVVTRYGAEADLQRTLAAVDEALYQSADTATLAQRLTALEGVEYAASDGKIHIRRVIDGDLVFEVVLGELNLGAAADRYTVLSYKQINTKEWSPSSDANVWLG